MDVASLAQAITGPVLMPHDPEYAAELAPFSFNAVARHTPDVVVGVTDAADVAGRPLGAAQGLPVAVQARGHGALVAVDRGVILSTRRMQHLELDPAARTVRVGAGVRWRSVVDAAAAAQGLAPLNGSSSGVGAVGYTLCGRVPALGRTDGFASDFVREFELVTDDGTIRTVSAHQSRTCSGRSLAAKPTSGSSPR